MVPHHTPSCSHDQSTVYNHTKKNLTPIYSSLKQRLRYMTSAVYPTIAQKVKHNQGLAGGRFVWNNLILKDEFPNGSFVMVEDELRTSKMQAAQIYWTFLNHSPQSWWSL